MSKEVHRFAHGENIVSMVVFRERLIVATNMGVYELIGDVLTRVQLVKGERND